MQTGQLSVTAAERTFRVRGAVRTAAASPRHLVVTVTFPAGCATAARQVVDSGAWCVVTKRTKAEPLGRQASVPRVAGLRSAAM